MKPLFPRTVPALLLGALLSLPASPGSAGAQTRIMPLGDSITHGGQGYCAYRYELWFDLLNAGYDVDFTGRQDDTNSGDPTPAWYPDYLTTFDRDHEGYWGWRTDEIAAITGAAATAGMPEIVLVHLGTNDIGQLGAAGVANADTNLRAIIGNLRAVVPDVTIVLAQVTPIGPGSSYFANAAQVGPLNATIAAIAADSNSVQSPVILVDQNTGFDLGTMMQSDGLHPNLTGEAFLSDVWFAVLDTLLVPGNVPPTVSITAPVAGSTFGAPANVSITADANDPDGAIAQVSFYADSTLLGVDTTAPYEYEWSAVGAGIYSLTATAEDDSGATRTSSAVAVNVLPFVGGTPVAVANPSFEDPLLPDTQLASGPGVIGGWTFAGTASTYTGIFNPPSGSYPAAGGNGTPAGADSANVAYLFHNGGVGDSVSATQTLADTLAADTEYLLTVAIGRFLPNQPYAFSTFGGYRIELRAGASVIASSEDEIDPPTGEFRDAYAWIASNGVDPGLIGQTLSIRLDISALDAPRSSHFDDVRLVRRAIPTGVANGGGTGDAAGADNTPGGARTRLRVFPNPFNPATTVAYGVGRPGPVSLAIYDMRGRLVEQLFANEHRSPGAHSFAYSSDLAAGVYFLRLRSPDGPATTRMVLLK